MNYIILSILVFTIGVFGLLVRRNLLVMLMSIELMLSAANIAFISFAKMNGGLDGHVVVLMVFVIAAAEAAVGLAIVMSLFRLSESVDIGRWKELRR